MREIAYINEITTMTGREDAKEVVARNVRALLAEKGWTHKDLQKRSGVAQTTISHIVRTGSTTTGRLDAIAKAVGLPGWALMVPKFPGISVLRGLAEVAELYLSCEDDGRAQIQRIAEAEARFAETKRQS